MIIETFCDNGDIYQQKISFVQTNTINYDQFSKIHIFLSSVIVVLIWFTIEQLDYSYSLPLRKQFERFLLYF